MNDDPWLNVGITLTLNSTESVFAGILYVYPEPLKLNPSVTKTFIVLAGL
jgi:hypothetical protein